jgi:hypothetical protein
MHENFMTNLRLSEPNNYNSFLQLDGPTFGKLLKTDIPTVSKRHTNLPEAITPSQRLSLTLH